MPTLSVSPDRLREARATVVARYGLAELRTLDEWRAGLRTRAYRLFDEARRARAAGEEPLARSLELLGRHWYGAPLDGGDRWPE